MKEVKEGIEGKGLRKEGRMDVKERRRKERRGKRKEDAKARTKEGRKKGLTADGHSPECGRCGIGCSRE